MILGVVGYRYYEDYEEFSSHLDNLGKIDEIVSGGCPVGHGGADKMAERYAEERKIKMTVFAPQGKGSHYLLKRNTQIVDHGLDKLIAFVHPLSRGTHDTIDKAKLRRIEVIEIKI